MPTSPWQLRVIADEHKALVSADGQHKARVLLFSCADFLGVPIEVAVTDKGLFVKSSCGWGMVEAWEAESVPEVLAHALR